MVQVLAQGTFDILHPGHLHYLREAQSKADELFVIVARGTNVNHKPDPILPDEQRREMVQSLSMVTEAVLGDKDDFLRPVCEIDPDIVVLGHDQHHDENAIETALQDANVSATVCRASELVPRSPEEFTSSSEIVEQILERRQAQQMEPSVIWPEHSRL